MFRVRTYRPSDKSSRNVARRAEVQTASPNDVQARHDSPQPKNESKPHPSATSLQLTASIINDQTMLLPFVGAEPFSQTTGFERLPVRPQTPLLAQHVAQQLSVSLRQPTDQVTEMSLDPVELGRVRIIVTAHDQTVTMTVTADRPETADLMRRHVDVLLQEFKALGYTSVNLVTM